MTQASHFIEIEGVKGIVRDKSYKGWIAIDHYTFGVMSSVEINNATGQLSQQGTHFDQISFAKDLDSTSTKLTGMVAEGKSVKRIVIVTAVNTEGKNHEVSRITFTDCMFSGLFRGVVPNSIVPKENMSFAYNSVSCETNTIDPEGQTSKQGPEGWNVSENTKL